MSGPRFVSVSGNPSAHPDTAQPRAASADTPSNGHGQYNDNCTKVYATGGGGGGGTASDGATGGDISSTNGGSKGTAAASNAALVPLRGGCSGGLTDGALGIDGVGGEGGGAIQIVSRLSITVEGVIDASGNNGARQSYVGTAATGSSGGGGGGGILLEAPTVELVGTAQLRAYGGDGASGEGTSYSSLGGAGAHKNTNAQPAIGAACDGVNNASSGGGGGGLGRIRINTRDGTYVKNSSVVEDGSLTTATHATR